MRREKEKDDQTIYAQHEQSNPEITDLDDEEVEEMLDEEGMEIIEDDEDGTVDLGEEF